MARDVEITFTGAGLEALLKAPEIQAELQRRANRVKAALGAKFTAAAHYGTPPEVIADTYVGKSRAGATVVVVHPEALEIEKKYRYLGSAIDAAGG